MPHLEESQNASRCAGPQDEFTMRRVIGELDRLVAKRAKRLDDLGPHLPFEMLIEHLTRERLEH